MISEPYFSPTGKLQQLSKENLLILLGGQRALLMQVAHPLVGQGVLDHSSVRKSSLKRLVRTLKLTQTLIFGTREQVLASAEKINRVHKFVKGTTRQQIGKYGTGTKYQAINNDLLIWVWATLIDTAITAYETFITPLSNEEKEEYYQEAKILLPLLGGDEKQTPKTFKEFKKYTESMYQNDALTVSTEIKSEIIPYLLLKKPNHLRLPLFPISYIIEKITTGLLPSILRQQYGLTWTERDQVFFNFAASTSRKVYNSKLTKFIPDFVRYSPYYCKQSRRMLS